MQKLLRSSYQKIESAVMPRESELQGIRASGFIRLEALVRYVEGMDFIEIEVCLEQEHKPRSKNTKLKSKNHKPRK